MNWQVIGVVLIVGWALWTLIHHFIPKKDKSCSTGSCGCGPEINSVKK